MPCVIQEDPVRGYQYKLMPCATSRTGSPAPDLLVSFPSQGFSAPRKFVLSGTKSRWAYDKLYPNTPLLISSTGRNIFKVFPCLDNEV
jgi:hypothetical protein